MGMKITAPHQGATVGTSFNATIVVDKPDMSVVSCTVGVKAADSITPKSPGGNAFTAIFTGVSAGTDVPLKAEGNSGDSETIHINVASP
jgi:hypothetical protein